jgi:hypothetical protein
MEMRIVAAEKQVASLLWERAYPAVVKHTMAFKL